MMNLQKVNSLCGVIHTGKGKIKMNNLLILGAGQFGLMVKEIAESMHLKETTVRVAVFRHKQDLIKHLEEYYRKENVL